MSLLNEKLSLKPGFIQLCDGLYGSSPSLFISELAKSSQQLTVVLTTDSLTAARVEREINFYLNQNQNIPVLVFPDWETLPYDHFSPHQDIISDRIKTLYQLPQLTTGIIIVPISTLMHRIAPKSYITACGFALNIGETFNPDVMRNELTERGYRYVPQVYEHGEFSMRGSLFDLFPMGSEVPYRVDLFDNEVESIRTFDPETQRTIQKVTHIDLLPAREFPLDSNAISLFRQQWREQFSGNPNLCSLYQDISQGICGGGIEYYLSLFFKETASLFDYLPANATIIQLDNLQEPAQFFWQEVKERYEQYNVDYTRPLLAPEKIFFYPDHIFAQIKAFNAIKILTKQSDERAIHFQTLSLPELTVNHKLTNPITKLLEFSQVPNRRILLCAETAGRREALMELLKKYPLNLHHYTCWDDFLEDTQPLGITIWPLDQGLSLAKPDLHVVAESQLFGQQVMQRRLRKPKSTTAENMVRNLAELSIGSPVVHIDYGVGRYLGLETMHSDGQDSEFLTLEYEGGDKLYVPIANLYLISRYSGIDLEHAPLHRLGNKKWDTTKQKAAKQLQDIAADLLAVYAKRESEQGHQYLIKEHTLDAFTDGFLFEETPDQEQAIQAVTDDMRSTKPMDRLICGDVGFGKTEVAMRAAFIAVENTKQVAILVPTTLLAQQHYETFKDRFADWPVNIEVISRFRTGKEQQKVVQQLEQGSIDIIIGTHKLLQADIKFKKLGLLIIDEEHRFGVQQKEKIKKLRAQVDLLTLTATPIPRTLNMAMSGVRDLSIIATPPAKRLSIKTFVHERSQGLIREAIMREIMRGGQVYFLHNKVETINAVAEELQQLIPEARIDIGHGQMNERDLERVMTNFYHQRFNVLVCTTIIETGIDIPTANTIIMDRADMFGLAQLHQLRGRVGRSHHQAYAYLLTPNPKLMTKDAIKRLEAIASLEDLGAGFTLATHDLEIRGAGEILGEEQSGHIQAMGLSLYTELLEKAVQSLKSGQDFEMATTLSHGTEIDLKISALIPENYMGDVHMRLVFYKRIAHCKTFEELDEIQVELIDRFGLMPEPLKNLFNIAKLKLKSQQLGIRKIDAGPFAGKLEFEEKTKIDPLKIIKLIQEQQSKYQLAGPTGLTFKLKENSPEYRYNEIEKLIDYLMPNEQI